MDVSSLIAVQSLFAKRRPVDPWGRLLSGSVANLLIYSDNIRIILPLADDGSTDKKVLETNNLHDFSMEPTFVRPVPYSTTQLRYLSDTFIATAFDVYIAWARRYAPYLSQFCALHAQPWVKSGHLRRVPNATVYDLAALKSGEKMSILAAETGLTAEQHIYCFDIILRFPMYGQFVGRDSFYLHHPIRDALKTPLNIELPGRLPPLGLNFAPQFRHITGKLSRNEYTTVIRVLREKVRHYGLTNTNPGDIHPDVIRKMAAEARLPPRLRSEASVVSIVATLLSAAAGHALADTVGALVGAIITITPAAWTLTKPYMPQNISSVTWLRWALRWDLEDNIKNVYDSESL